MPRAIPSRYRHPEAKPDGSFVPIFVICALASIVAAIAYWTASSDDRYSISDAEIVLARGDVALIDVAPDGTPLWAKRLPDGQTVYFGGREAISGSD